MKKFLLLILIFGVLLGAVLAAMIVPGLIKPKQIEFTAEVQAPDDVLTQLYVDQPGERPAHTPLHSQRGNWKQPLKVPRPKGGGQPSLRAEVQATEPGAYEIEPSSGQPISEGRAFLFTVTRMGVSRTYTITVTRDKKSPIPGAVITTDPPTLMSGPVITDALGKATLQVRGDAGQFFSVQAASEGETRASANLVLSEGEDRALGIDFPPRGGPSMTEHEVKQEIEQEPKQEVKREVAVIETVERSYVVLVRQDGATRVSAAVKTDPSNLAKPASTNVDGIAELLVRGPQGKSFQILASLNQKSGRSGPLTLTRGDRDTIKIDLPKPDEPPKQDDLAKPEKPDQPPAPFARAYTVRVKRGEEALAGVSVKAGFGTARGTTDAQGEVTLEVTAGSGTQMYFVATVGGQTQQSEKVPHEQGPGPAVLDIRFRPEKKTIPYSFQASYNNTPLSGVAIHMENETGLPLVDKQTGDDGKATLDVEAEVGETLTYQVVPPNLQTDCESPRTADRLVHGQHTGTIRLDWTCGPRDCDELERDLQTVLTEAWGIAFRLMIYVPGSLGDREQVKQTAEIRQRKQNLIRGLEQLVQQGASSHRCPELMVDIALAQMLAEACVGNVESCEHNYTSKYMPSHRGYCVPRNAAASLYRALARTIEGQTARFDETLALLEDVDRQFGEASSAVSRIVGGRRHCVRAVLYWQRANGLPIPPDLFDLQEKAKTNALLWERWSQGDANPLDSQWIPVIKEKVSQ